MRDRGRLRVQVSGEHVSGRQIGAASNKSATTVRVPHREGGAGE
jgi:hypothetical protein